MGTWERVTPGGEEIERKFEALGTVWAVSGHEFEGARVREEVLWNPALLWYPPRNGNFWYINRFSLAMNIGILASRRLLGASDFITGTQRRKVGRHWTVAPQRQSDLGNHTSPALLDSQLSVWVCPMLLPFEGHDCCSMTLGHRDGQRRTDRGRPKPAKVLCEARSNSDEGSSRCQETGILLCSGIKACQGLSLNCLQRSPWMIEGDPW